MAAETKKTLSPTSTPATAPSRAKLSPQQVSAGRRILGLMQAHHQRVKALDTVAAQAYQELRVYHGTHDAHAVNILTQGLKAQGGKGLSEMIGDKNRSRGHVFFTRDKEQAASYGLTAAGMHKSDLMREAGKADDEAAIMRIIDKPPRATVLRLMLSPDVQKQAVQDAKGDQKDYMLRSNVGAGHVLPGALEAETNMGRRAEAVSLFQRELQKRDETVSPSLAAASLARMRRKSIAGDAAALDSDYAKESSRTQLAQYTMMSAMF